MMSKIRQYFENEYSRNVVLNYVFRIITIALGLFSTKLVIGYLGATLYGLWVTITSVISWMNSGDLGIGNGLRNELAKAYSLRDTIRQTKLINTAFASLSRLAIIVFGILVLVSEILFATNILESTLRIPMYITSVFFSLNLMLGVSQSIAYAYQKSWFTTFTHCAIQVILILVIVFLKVTEIDADLKSFSILHGICSTIPNIFLILVLRKSVDLKKGTIGFRFDKETAKSIMSTGMQFFGLQLCMVVLYSTDSLIINKIISTEMVTKYNVITKVYDTGTSLFSILLIALWSAVTYRIAQNDITWIKKQIRELLIYWLIFSTGVLSVSILFNPIVKIWIGNEAFYYEPRLVCVFGVYCSVTAFSAIFVNVLNGLGIVKLQLILAIFEAIINIPLSVFFARTCGLGITGVKLGTLICASITATAIPIQAVREIKKFE